jgi:hypothetical protein
MSEREQDRSAEQADDAKVPFSAAYDQLPPGIAMDDLRTAILRSGYPFQATVANVLRDSFDQSENYVTIQEEWAFLDSETSQVRSIDVFAEMRLGKHRSGRLLRVRPYLNILVECKQSEMPYIFFLRGESPGLHYDFPEIAGLRSSDIVTFSEKDGQVKGPGILMSIYDVLAFWTQPFFDFPFPFAISISKAARGRRIELTGEEAYRSLTLPLMKAADHIKKISEPSPESDSFTCRILVCLAVLRAPMFGVVRDRSDAAIAPIPWVRVCRLEPQQPGQFRGTSSIVRYYDAVHETHLPEYLTRLKGDVDVIASRIEKAADVIADGRGISGNEEETYRSLRSVRSEDNLPDSSQKYQYRIAKQRPRFKIDINLEKEVPEEPGGQGESETDAPT